MKTSKQLREERSAISSKIDAMSNVENLNDAQKTELRSLVDSEAKLTSEIELALEMEKRNATLAGGAASTAEKRESEKFSFGKLVRELAEGRGDENAVTGLEKELIQESAKEKRDLGSQGSGLYLSNKFMTVEKRTMSTGTSTAGGNFIPTQKIPFFDALYAKTVLDQLGAVKLTGLSANADLTGFSAGVTAGWATEVADASAGDPTTASRSITPKRLTAYVDLSKQLLIQDNYSIEAYTQESFMKAFAVAIEAAAINGSGSSGQPTGLLGTSGIGSVVMGPNGAAPSLAKILELIQVVESANAGMNGKFLVNPKLVAKLKQTVIDSGSGAMIMSYGPYFGGVAEQIDGKPVFSTSNVPSNLTKGSSSGVCSAMIYGDFDNLVVGQYGGIDLVVDTMSQAIGGKTRIVMNQYVGIAVKQPAAFAAIQDLTTT
jgi:HK97 family phage major capsid protein